MKVFFEIQKNDKILIKSSKGTLILRTIEDFSIFFYSLNQEINEILIPRLINFDYLSWMKKLLEFNKNPFHNEMLLNFLTNKEFFLLKKNNDFNLSYLTDYFNIFSRKKEINE